MAKSDFDAWSAGQSYEHYMGRWSRKIAEKFIDWVDPPTDAEWLETGCGTGALTDIVLSKAAARSLLATDQSVDFVAHASKEITDKRVAFKVADATALPCPDASIDLVTSALVLNFISDKALALDEMRRVLRSSGRATFYVWDYPGGGMGFIDAFWKSAAEIDPHAADLDESERFPFCQKDGLVQICQDAGATNTEIAAIKVETLFPDFEAYWHPFTLGAGPAPGYLKSLTEDRRQQLKDTLRVRIGTDGPVSLPARAWAVKTRWSTGKSR
ncbi:class I SAM-dependent methyltransferase [uncultured Roseobacter sp.]|uniref:class I SAM-dependent methyltransferase n=1 Tax=uncultured Roseobacter sp. TaxID=114847 RepID=UPI00260CBB31|nr:class I SAM-dependent methyltransferase [uncultured Roseobacter sp.]